MEINFNDIKPHLLLLTDNRKYRLIGKFNRYYILDTYGEDYAICYSSNELLISEEDMYELYYTYLKPNLKQKEYFYDLYFDLPEEIVFYLKLKGIINDF